jgi:predicted secreted acid phosphatase
MDTPLTFAQTAGAGTHRSLATCRPLENRNFSILAELDSTTSAIRFAVSYLGCMHPLCSRPAVVLDIDGTVLINEPSGRSKCVMVFRRLAETCKAAGVQLFAVTARPDSGEGSNEQWTLRQLEHCGIEPVHLFMRPPSADYAAFKHECRQKIRGAGYTILLAIGDQFADLCRHAPRGLDNDKVLVGTLGDDGGLAIKLPSEY